MRLLPLVLLATLPCLAGCTGYSPPPQAVLNCEQYRQVGDFEYLNCLRGQNLPANQPAPQKAASAPQ